MQSSNWWKLPWRTILLTETSQGTFLPCQVYGFVIPRCWRLWSHGKKVSYPTIFSQFPGVKLKILQLDPASLWSRRLLTKMFSHCFTLAQWLVIKAVQFLRYFLITKNNMNVEALRFGLKKESLCFISSKSATLLNFRLPCRTCMSMKWF